MMHTVQSFCDKHCACNSGKSWALANCPTMHDAWHTAKPEWVTWIATRKGVLDDKTLRLFAIYSASRVRCLMKDPRSVTALIWL